MNKKWKMGLVLATMLSALVVLTACDLNIGGVSTKDATNYIKGDLDCTYLGVYSPEYLKILEIDEAEAAEQYEWNVEQEGTRFLSYIGVDDYTDAQLDQARELMREIYTHSKYEVGNAEKLSDGTFTSQIKIWPIEIMQQFTSEQLDELIDEALTELNLDSNSDVSDEDYAKFTDLYVTKTVELVSGLIPSLEYGTEQSVALRLQEDADGNYVMSDTDWGSVDDMIIDYSGTFQG